MAESLNELVAPWHTSALLATLVVSIVVLGKAADWLVEEAVNLSLRSGMPRVIVGATIVSLGTTAPEAVVSVLAAVQGNPGLALGNAVGSIICDTGLILGLACIITPLPIDRRLVNSQGWVQFACGLLLIGGSLPWSDPTIAFSQGGRLPQVGGFVFVGLLIAYIVWSIRLAKSSKAGSDVEPVKSRGHRPLLAIIRMAVAMLFLLVASSFLIAVATELAERLQVPPSVVAATLVAFGTSLPELIIVMTAVAKGHGELAVGNVIGADILNVLFVAGAAAAVTPVGLVADPHFFQMQFPAMLGVLLIFRIGIWTARSDQLGRAVGVLLLMSYVAVTVLSYFV